MAALAREAGEPVTERPDVAPCLSCRWNREARCVIRAPDRRSKARSSVTERPLPEDLGASCPRGLWDPCVELRPEPLGLQSAMAWCAEEAVPGTIGTREFNTHITAVMKKGGVKTGPFKPCRLPTKRRYGW